MDTALQSSVYVSSPEFAGWLMKRGFHWRKLWKKRWVALHGAEIVYMDKEPTVENSNSLTITKAQITTATVIDRDDIDGNPNGFAIHINDGHTPTWYLRAESAREKKSWLMRLSHVHAIVRWLEDFEKVKVLGVGGTGIVYELLHKSNGSRYAMKEMEIKNKAQMQMAISEAEMLKDIMENISHPNIMHIEKVFQVGSKFYLVFPLCTGGELYEHIIRKGHFTEHDAAVLTRDLVSGLHALHEHDILHLDIKPENLLFDGMGDNAKIKITDFGLSKLISDSAENQKKEKFSMQLMEERLRTLAETGELNREKLRGTIGYMAPELILTGHCSKATDVFAVGVVLFILLCGRPPFNSKSNREVLEKTARGQYSMVGAEWDDISAEAKDLVTRMLKVNPDERISTTDILNHPWIKHLDEEPDDLSSTSSASNDVVTGVVKSPGSFSGSQRSVNRKGTGMNLANALRHLSGHVKQLRSEKFASNVTKLVSLMQQNGQNKSTLTKLYLVPMHNTTPAPPTDPNHPNQPPRDEDQGAESIIKESEMNEEEYETWFLSPDFREGFSAAIRNFSDDDSGRLSIEQFMSLLKYVHTNSTGISTNNQGLAPLIIGKFIDRDNDGYITPDDIFAAQALIMQRSEIFLKVVFRIYAESIWYPGRQLNLRSLMSQANMKGNNDNVGSMTPGGSKVLTNDNMLPSVVEPPKFITARHIAAVFEKLGYEPALGQKAFTILCEGLSRIKTDHNERIDECDEREASPERVSTAPINTPNAALARAFEDMDDTETPRKNGKFGNPDEVSTKVGGTNRDSTSNLRQSDASEKVGNNPPPVNSPTAAAAGSARMDLQDFVRAAELDDILIQVIFRKARHRMVSLMHEAETKYRTLSMNDNMNDLGISEKNISPDNDYYDSMKRKPRLSSKDITATLIEEELKSAFTNLRASEPSRPTFPIANAVGRATLSAALGLATKVAVGTQALMEATYETFDGSDDPNLHIGSSRSQSLAKASSSKGLHALAGVDSDDES